MKKSISILLSLVFVLAIVAGCSGDSDGAPLNGRQRPTEGGLIPPGSGGSANIEGPAMAMLEADSADDVWYDDWRYVQMTETDEFATASESPFKDVVTSPLSTFSISVDTASYSIMRRQIMNGRVPTDLRIEELINYFDYDYPAPMPGSEHPFSIITEVAVCPWAPGHLLAKVAIQGIRLQNTDEIANNIVFLIDVSGSMDRPDRLPLVIESMKLVLEQLGENDRISILTYAGSDRILADSVPGSERELLMGIVGGLRAGGSTSGAQALRNAYDLAAKNFIEGGNNRIILATDGDFNVGESSVEDIIRLVESQRDRGIFISVLGYGMGNLKDNIMEAIATNGNGNYAYIDTIQEARKVLVDEFDSTMFTIARDVKIQLEFNPETISEYRLIGYDTRRLQNEDFNDDTKDAGEIGSGHNVTVFFELVPVGMDGSGGLVDPLRYSTIITTGSDDFMTVKVRYKDLDGDESRLVERAVGPADYVTNVSNNFMFASAVAEFGLIVTDSNFKGQSSLDSVLERADAALGSDDFGLRAEFLDLVRRYGQIVGW